MKDEKKKGSRFWSENAIKLGKRIKKEFIGGYISEENKDEHYEPLKERFRGSDIKMHYSERDGLSGEPDKTLLPAMTKFYDTITASTFPFAKNLKLNPVDFTQQLGKFWAEEVKKVHMENHGIILENKENQDEILAKITDPITIGLRKIIAK